MKQKTKSSKKSARVADHGGAAALEMFNEVARPITPVIVQGARSYREFRKAYSGLAEEDARRAYLDMIDKAIAVQAADTSSWASLYEAADLGEKYGDEQMKKAGEELAEKAVEADRPARRDPLAPFRAILEDASRPVGVELIGWSTAPRPPQPPRPWWRRWWRPRRY